MRNACDGTMHGSICEVFVRCPFATSSEEISVIGHDTTSSPSIEFTLSNTST